MSPRDLSHLCLLLFSRLSPRTVTTFITKLGLTGGVGVQLDQHALTADLDLVCIYIYYIIIYYYILYTLFPVAQPFFSNGLYPLRDLLVKLILVQAPGGARFFFFFVNRY